MRCVKYDYCRAEILFNFNGKQGPCHQDGEKEYLSLKDSDPIGDVDVRELGSNSPCPVSHPTSARHSQCNIAATLTSDGRDLGISPSAGGRPAIALERLGPSPGRLRAILAAPPG